jgi:transmembrane sensor
MQARINAATNKPVSVITFPFIRIAASLLLAGSIVLLIRWHMRNEDRPVEYLTIKTGTNDIKRLMLSDSSVVWLNSASVLQVPVSFHGKQRESKLLEGEAFFDVKHDAGHPFIVHVKNLSVQVMGTSFNIKTYKGLNTTEVTVATGKVGVIKSGKVLQMLLPGQLLSYNNNKGSYTEKYVNADQVQGWRSGNTYLNQAGFDELALAVKNIFGLTLKAGNSRVGSYRFSLSMRHNLLPVEALKIISQIHNTHYRKEGDVIILY